MRIGRTAEAGGGRHASPGGQGLRRLGGDLTDPPIGHPACGRIRLAVNDEIKQDQDIADLIWGVEEIISILSHSMRIQPGDLIYTGTPAGVGPLQIGDRVTGGVEGVGEQAFTIVAPHNV